MKAEQIQPGTPVYDRTMKMIGTVARTWSPEGVVNPPMPLSGGTFRIEGGTRVLDEGVGYFQLHRLFAPDWFIPFTDVAGVWSSYVILKVTEEEGRRSGWHIEPILYPTPSRASNAQFETVPALGSATKTFPDPPTANAADVLPTADPYGQDPRTLP